MDPLYITVRASNDPLSHATNNFFNLNFHMVLHIYISSDVNQHGAVLFSLPAKFTHSTGQNKRLDRFM